MQKFNGRVESCNLISTPERKNKKQKTHKGIQNTREDNVSGSGLLVLD